MSRERAPPESPGALAEERNCVAVAGGKLEATAAATSCLDIRLPTEPHAPARLHIG
jgi:hypothetical protein